VEGLIELHGYPSRVEEDAAGYKAVSLAASGRRIEVRCLGI
jgi:hypothetical protein